MSSTPRRKRAHQPNSSASHANALQSTPHTHPEGHGHQRTRSRHLANQALSNQITSDWESDTASYMPARLAPQPVALAQRTNTELNMSVLKRYLPNVTDIRSTASHVVVYALDAKAGSWEKANTEGTLFVCELDGQIQKSCIFILNRKGLNNLTLSLTGITDIELKENLLMLVEERESGEQDASHVLGLYIHADQEDTRATMAGLIQDLWRAARASLSVPNTLAQQHARAPGPASSGLQEITGGGRQVSLSELFGR